MGAPNRLPDGLVPLWEHPRSSALFLDFDGTLSPIVADPADAAPLVGVPGVLAALAARFSLVAVVSGRPASFLAAALDRPRGVHIAGLYGLERIGADGVVRTPGGAEHWRPVVAGVAAAATAAAPPGVVVEPKGFTVTLHWRGAPGAEGWARAFAEREMRRTGLTAQPGRLALELRPPLAVDKGTVVAHLAPGHRAVACFGDDLGDLPAFAELGRLAGDGVAVVRVAVTDAGSPPEVAAAADVVVDGPAGALALLELLAAAPSL